MQVLSSSGCARQTPDRPKRCPRAPKLNSGDGQDTQNRVPNTPKIVQERARSIQMAPRQAQGNTRAGPGRPRAAPYRPQAAPDWPRTAPGSPRQAQTGPGQGQDSPRQAPGRPHARVGRAPRPSQEPVGGAIGALWHPAFPHFWACRRRDRRIVAPL